MQKFARFVWLLITQDCPSWQSVAERYQTNPLSACFASRIERLIGKSQLWIHGHTHDSFDYDVNGTRVVCNPRGYVRNGIAENLNFNAEMLLKLTK